jgi:hypothetical protein
LRNEIHYNLATSTGVYIFKGGSRRGLKSGIKIIHDRTSRIKKHIVE